MITIRAYPVREDVEIPKGARVLHCGYVSGEIMVWAMVDTKVETEIRKFTTYATGKEIQLPTQYIGTVQSESHIAGFVWHVFEEI